MIAMMRFNIMVLICGYLVTLVGFNVNGVDVIADCIGYAMIFAALLSLGRIEHNFAIAQTFAALAGIASVLNIAVFGRAWIYTALHLVLSFFLLWYICTGIASFASTHGNVGLSKSAAPVRKLTLVATSVYLVVDLIARMSASIAVPFAMAAVTLGLVTTIFMLVMLYRASRELTMPA